MRTRRPSVEKVDPCRVSSVQTSPKFEFVLNAVSNSSSCWHMVYQIALTDNRATVLTAFT